MTEEQLTELRDLISGLKMEYYDLLHEFGYADFKLKEEPVVGYEARELWLSDVYEKAFMDWHTYQLELAKIEARLSECQSWKCKNSDNTSAIEKRVAELTKQKDLLTNENK